MNIKNTSRIEIPRSRWLLTLFSLLALLGMTAPAHAHNLQTKMVYMFFDPATQNCLDARIAQTTPYPAECASVLPALPPGWTPGDPILQNNDELGMIIKVIPRDGTTTGVGGHVDFYVPNGVEVIDVGYVLPNGSGGYDKVPMKGQSLIAEGAGPIGASTTAELSGLSGASYASPNGTTTSPVGAGGIHKGTIAGVYGDTGIFFSTDPDTSYGSWQRFTGDATLSDFVQCGTVGYNTLSAGKTITNNSGDTFIPCNKWDAEQMYGWGAAGTTYAGAALRGGKAIVDYPNQRGNAPWGFASGVAGPQSGYAWNFDWDEYQAADGNPLVAANPFDANQVIAGLQSAANTPRPGPWQRIQYPGSRISFDQPGSLSSVLGLASKDASTLGVNVSALQPTVSQTANDSSPKAIRWAVGQLTNLVPEYAYVKVKMVDNTLFATENGCPRFNGDTFGGDAGGSDGGKDHLWRYYEPSRVTVNACMMPGKPTDLAGVKLNQIIQYKVKTYNMGTVPMTNVVIKDTLVSGLTFISASPSQDTGPNPLVWNIPTLLPGQKFESVVTAKVTGSGAITNDMCVNSTEYPNPSCIAEVVSTVPILKQSKTASPTAIAPDGTIDYTIRIDNLGGSASAGPTKIVEHLDANLTCQSFTSATLNGASVTPTVTGCALLTGSSTPEFTFATGINAGSALVLSFKAKVAAATPPGSYCNWFTTYTGSTPNSTGSLACISVAGGKIGDTIWRDWNGNGVQDVGEEGMAGVTVTLEKWNGSSYVQVGLPTLTDANGNYYFNGLEAGQYRVTVTPPANTAQTGDPDQPGAACSSCDHQQVVTLTTDQQYLASDFGYRPTGAASIGDKVFEDVNNNGVFDGGDAGINSVTVWLYEDGNNNGVIDTGDALVATTASSGGGNYSFPNLATGFNYLVKVDQTDPDIQTYFNTTYGGTPPYQISTAETIASPSLSGDDLDNDFGFWKVLPATLGDQVFIDLNGNGTYQLGADTPLSGVTVNLYRDNVLVATQMTDAAGQYTFGNLGPGSYQVVVDTASTGIPAGYSTSASQYTKTLTAGQTDLTADFPFTPLISKTATPAYATTGQTVNYSVNVSYNGDALLSDARVIDPYPAGLNAPPTVGQSGVYGAYVPLDGVPGADAIAGTSGNLNLSATKDTSLNSGNTGRNYGNCTTVDVYDVRRGLLQFDLSAIPAGSVVNSANLSLVRSAGQNNTTDISAFRLTQSWNEGNKCDQNAVAGEATWNNSGTAAWTGGAWVDADGTANVTTTPYSTVAVVGNATYVWDLASMAQEWVDGAANHGVILIQTGANQDKNFDSRTGTTPPVLAVNYTPYTNTTTTLTTSATTATQNGSPITVTMTLGAQYNAAAYTNVAPGALTVSGGSAACSAGSPATATVPVNGTVAFTYTCTLHSLGEYTFSANATNGSYTFPTGKSPSVLASADGSANVVRWLLGSNAAGSASTKATAANIYAFQGGSTAFWAYHPADNTWNGVGNDPADIGSATATGAALTTDGTRYVYALQGNGQGFQRFDAQTLPGSWTALTSTGTTVGAGGAVIHLNGTVYALMGGVTTTFKGYSVSGGTWTTLAATPAAVGVGGSLATDGANVYALRGNKQKSLYRYNVATNTWTTLANAPDNIGAGGALRYANGAFYAQRGDGKQNFYRYNIAANTWTNLTSIGTNVNAGGALAYDGTYLYATLGNNGTGFRRYDITAGTWSAMAVAPGNVVAGGALTFLATGNTTRTVETGVPSMVTGGTAITVTMNLTSNYVINNVAAGTITPTGTNGASASCGSATLTSADDDLDGTANDVVRYTWTCTATAGASPGSVSFVATANGTDFSPATSNSVLVIPVLTYSATVNGAPPVAIRNTALLKNVTATTVPSNTTSTSTTTSIGDRVWVDSDGDTIQDPGEIGVPGVTVRLYAADGTTLLQTTTTDASGNYRFYNISAATTYKVVLDTNTDPAGYTPTTPTTLTVSGLTAGQQYDLADFGLQPGGGANTGSIGDYVWLDADSDGMQDAAEAPLPGIVVRLYRDLDNDGAADGDDALIGATTTDAAGLYSFDNLLIGADAGNPVRYLVVVDTTSTVTSTYNPSVTTTLGAGMAPTTGTVNPKPVNLYNVAGHINVDTADFGYNWTGSIGDTLFYDTNRDGTQSGPTETGAPNATVLLYLDVNGDGQQDSGDTIIATTFTNGSGVYLFDNLPPGKYIVKGDEQTVPAPPGSPNAGATNVMNGTTGTRRAVDLQPGQDYLQADIGFAQVAKIEGTVWYDPNNNGLLEPGETIGLAGLTVTLTGTDAQGNPVTATATTNAAGGYQFLVPDGNYTVTYAPGGFASTYPNATTPASLSLTVISGAEYKNNDFGRTYSGQLGDRVWNDANANDTQDAGEAGLAGITVQLWNSGETTLLATTVTDASGNYSFGGLADASYVVKVVPASLPGGFTETYDNSGSQTDHTGTGTISGGNTVNTVDFGYQNAASYTVSGNVWKDDGAGGGTASDGTKNGTEPGIQTVGVSLMTIAVIDGKVDINGDGVITTADDGNYGGYAVTDGVLAGGAVGQTLNGMVVRTDGAGGGLLDADGNGFVDASDDKASAVFASTTTPASGDYSFVGVPNGDYQIRVNSATLPSGAYIQTGDPDGCSGSGVNRTCTTPDLTVVRVNNANVANQNFGYNEFLGSLAGTLCDGNGDGLCNSETAVANVTVYLTWAGPDGFLGTADDVVVTQVTDASGNYVFNATTIAGGALDNGLPPGEYRITKTDPANKVALADADGGNPSSISITLTVGQAATDQDFELQGSPGGIGDTVWLDTDRDGVQDIGETGLANVSVELAPAYSVVNGAIDLNGSGVSGTDDGWLRGVQIIDGELDINGDGTANGSDDGSFFGTPVIDGLLDLNRNNTVGEALDTGYTGGDSLATEVTDLAGKYLFTSVPAGNYLVLVNENTLPGPAGSLTETAGTTNASGLITLAAGATYLNADFGYVGDPAKAMIGNFVWADANGNGTQDAGEPGIGGVTLKLTTATGGQADDPNQGGTQDYIVTTAADGSYAFVNLLPGTYKVDVTDTGGKLAGYTLTIGPQSSTDPTAAITVGAGTIYDKADFGYVNPSLFSVSDKTWYDADRDGVFDATEQPIAGVTVDLIQDENGDGITNYTVIAGRIDVNDDGQIDTSDDTASGKTLGGYRIVDGFVDLNSDGVITGADDGSYKGFTVINGVIDLNGSGSVPTNAGRIGDLVWLDANGDSIKDATEVGLPGVTVRLCSDASCTGVVATTTTDANGAYSFGGLAAGNYYVNVNGGVPAALTGTLNPTGTTAQIALLAGQNYTTADFGYQPNTGTAVIGDRIWSDADGDGVQDAGEAGIGGVTVSLTGPGCSPCTTVTAADGSYRFTNLAAGSYTVAVTPPGGYTQTGDPDGTLNNQSAVTVVAGDVKTNLDFGYRDTTNAIGSLGNTVYTDANGNGVQDAGEDGLSGVTVNLYSDPDGNPVTFDGALLATTTTNYLGQYNFTGLPVSIGGVVYGVLVTDTAGVLANAVQTADPSESGVCVTCDRRGTATLTTGLPTNDAQDFGFNFQDNGNISPEPVIASTTSAADGSFSFAGVPNGSYSVRITDNAGKLTDVQGTTTAGQAGELGVTVAGADVSGVHFGYAGLGPIGDTIYSDANQNGVQDPGEPGIAGVTVTLYLDSNGNGTLDVGTDTQLATDTTDTTGGYLFDDLPSGVYFVKVTPPTGTLTGDPDGGCPGACVTPNETKVTLTSSEPSFLGADFGYYNAALANVSGTVWSDANRNAVIDGGEGKFQGVTVQLRDATGNVVAYTTTDASGNYVFQGVPNGSYKVVVVDQSGVLNGYFLTSGLDQIPVTVSGSPVTGINFGYARQTGTGSIGDTVWLDANDDGQVQANETGLSGVTLRLYADRNGNGSVDTTVTVNSNKLDLNNSGGPANADDDGVWYGVTVIDGQLDVNNDGAITTADDGTVNGITVTDGLIQTANGSIDGAWAQTTTDANGNYLFGGLPANSYTVDVISGVPAGLSVSTGTTDPTATINLANGQAYLNADFGYKPATGTVILGDTVWYDTNGDGIQNPGEVGLGGVTVIIAPPAGTDLGNGAGVPVTTTTTADGSWLYTGLPAGVQFTVRVDPATLPNGLVSTPTNLNGGDRYITDTMTAGDVLSTLDFGYNGAAAGSIGDTVWLDTNRDGDPDAGEPPLSGVNLQLYAPGPDGIKGNADDKLLGATYSDANGHYLFSGLLSGNYYVKIDSLALLLAGLDPTTFLSGDTPVISLIAGQDDLNADFGFKPATGTAVIGDRIWSDADGDGVQDAGEAGLGGVTVNLNGPGCSPCTTTTAADGSYLFIGLTPGSYTASVVDGALGTATGDPDATKDGDHALTVAADEVRSDVDFGYQNATGSIGDKVWGDTDGNGILNGGETGLSGVTVALLDNTGAVIATTTTNASGDYLFTGLKAGSYSVQVTDTANKLVGYRQTGDPDQSGVPCTTCDGRDAGITLATDSTAYTAADFGYRPTGTTGAIGDTVWLDMDADGQRDAREGGLSGVVVELRDGTCMPGNNCPTTITDLSGNYLFSNVTAGSYTVAVVSGIPAGLTLVSGTNPTASITLAAGQSHLDADFGYRSTTPTNGVIGDRIWNDANGNGVEDAGEAGIGAVTVYLCEVNDPDSPVVPCVAGNALATAVTDADGSYLFTNVLPSDVGKQYKVQVDSTDPQLSGYTLTKDVGDFTTNGYTVMKISPSVLSHYTIDFGYQNIGGANGVIGDTVYRDTNGNGVQDAGETGLAGVTLNLLNSGQIVASATTNASGQYSFTGLPPGSTYTVVVTDNNIVLQGLSATQTPSQPLTITCSGSCTLITTADFGYSSQFTGSIGDTVYFDKDGNSTQGGGEPGIAGVTVQLLNCGAGTCSDGDETVLATKTTDASGQYNFTGLPPGNYRVNVTTSTTSQGSVLYGLSPSQTAASPITITCATASTCTTYTTADFGYAPTTGGTGSLGGTLWRDTITGGAGTTTGILNAGEPGIPGATVELWLDVNGGGIQPGIDNLVRTTTTNANGDYLFLGLPAGNYVVRVPDSVVPDVNGQLGANPVLTGLESVLGSAPTTDNNGHADPYAVTLAAGATDTSVDFAYLSPTGYSLSGTVFEDNGASGGTGLGSFTDPVANPTDPLRDVYAPGATVTLYRVMGGVEYPYGTTTTSSTGAYSFTGLPPGTYVVRVNTAGTIVAGMQQTDDPDSGGTSRCTVCDSQTTQTIGAASIANLNFGYWNGGVVTTPVTLSYFKATVLGKGGQVRFEWATATEVSTLGFDIYVEDKPGRWKLINPELIPAQDGDSMDMRTYTYTASGVTGNTFMIHDLDSSGVKTPHGPYSSDRDYGVKALPVKAIDWKKINQESDGKKQQHEQRKRDRIKKKVDKDRNDHQSKPKGKGGALGAAGSLTERLAGMALSFFIGSAQATELPLPDTGLARMEVTATGVQRVTYEQLLAAGVDLTGVDTATITVRNNGQTVPVYVYRGSGASGFGAGGFLEFLGEGVDTLYTKTNVYNLSLEAGSAIPDDVTAAPPKGAAVAYYMETAKVENEVLYTTAAPNGDPWAAAALTATSKAVTGSYTIQAQNYAGAVAPSIVNVGLFGMSAGPHHLQVFFNTIATPVVDEQFSDTVDHPVSATLPATAVVEGTNTVKLVLPFDTGVSVDRVVLDQYRLTYPRKFIAQSGRLKFTAAGAKFTVDALPSNDARVYRVAANGQVVRLSNLRYATTASGFSVTFPGTTAAATYYVSASAATLAPKLTPPSADAEIGNGPASYVVIAHPDFIGATLDRLVNLRVSQGYTVKVVDVDDVYAHFGYGQFDPQAIKDFIAYAYHHLDTRMVLLVGGDTYDYFNYRKLNAKSFIPSLYGQTGPTVFFAPVDPKYADVDNDSIPDLAIGRLPVRTSQELDAVINNTLTYANASPAYGQKAVFAADVSSDAEGYCLGEGDKGKFKCDAEAMIARLPALWQETVSRAYLSDLGVAAAKSALLSSLNGGVALTSYVGHSAVTTWTNSGLFNGNDAAGLLNAGKPTIVTQWGCWNTYYASPTQDSLGHRFMLNGNKGAAAVLGASTVTLAGHERQMAIQVYDQLFQSAAPISLGEAVLLAKRNYGAIWPADADVLLGWTILGDPAITIQP